MQRLGVATSVDARTQLSPRQISVAVLVADIILMLFRAARACRITSAVPRPSRNGHHKPAEGRFCRELNISATIVLVSLLRLFQCYRTTAMFSERLSALLALIGVAVAAVQLPVKESDSISGILADNQVPLQYSTRTQPEVANAWVDRPFDTDPLQPEFEPVGELSAVGSDQWTTLHHPVFPRYSVRIKRSRFCDTTVK